MDLKIVLEIIERPWFKYFVLGLVVGVIFGAGLTYTAVNLLIIQQRESTIQDLRYDLSTEGLVRKNMDDRIVRLSGTIVQQNEEIKRLEATQCPNGSGIICKQPMAIIWEIGYDDGRYEEFDPLPEFPGRFPWEYKEGESFDRFPKEINDGRRTPIRIKFSLNDTQLKNDFILTLIIESVNKDFFNLRIRTQNGVVGTYTFNNTKKMQEIVINKDKVIEGENAIILENANTASNDRWMLWDYLSLKTCEVTQ